MTLPLPQLDTRTYDSLVSDALTLLPRYAPDWTDHNTHDPGITLIELFAWLAEMDLYRLDRVTEASTRAFLRLLGIEPRPAQVAETVLALARNGVYQASVKARTRLTTVNHGVKFQTTHSIWVSRAKLQAVLAGSYEALADYTNDNTSSGKRFSPLGLDPQPGDALYLGFDQRVAFEPKKINLYVWCGEPEADRQIKRALVNESNSARKEAAECNRPAWKCDSDSDQTKRSLACRKLVASPTFSWLRHYSARSVWEFYADGGKWLPLAKVLDRTRALTLSGPVRFTAPEPAKHIVGGVSSRGYGSLFFIRCRLVSGSFDCPPQIRFVQINTVCARHTVDAKTSFSSTPSTGRSGQIYQLPEKPIVARSTTLEVRSGSTVQKDWREHLYWDRVGPHDHGYLLDSEGGELIFGNGRTGAVPKAGSELSVTYRVGGGVIGNVPTDTHWTRINNDTITVSQPFAAFGGAPAESLFAAKSRAVAWLSKPHRAVTLKDFEQLALDTPGVPVARAKALADYDPKLPCVSAPGSVTVVVISKCPQTHPVPGPDLLRAVEQYLERRRLLTAEVHVIGPDYTKVAVHATLHATPDASRELVAQAEASLNQFFDPIIGGQDANGWPMGRAVYRSEILARLNALPGVFYVDDVTLETVLETPKAECDCCHEQEKAIPAQCGNIEICPHGLVTSGQHQIKVLIERAV